MSLSFDDLTIQHQLNVGLGVVPFFGLGPAKIRGAAYIEGPLNVGTPFPLCFGAVNIGPLINPDSPPPFIPGGFCYGPPANPFSLAVLGSVGILGDLNIATNVIIGGNLFVQGLVLGSCGGHLLQIKKNFDIPHPSKEGWRLRHTCPEAPYNDVYIRGRVTNQKEINLPAYWKDFVDVRSITVNLTPIGSHQHVMVKRIDENKIYLQSNGGMPIDCFYHIFAERKDGEKLIPEYPGQSPADYPGDNSGYSIAGYNYDVR
jgi:hypothetical protein